MNAALFLSSLAWALLDFVWQGVLVGCAAAALLGLLGRARPQLRYALACAALLLCAALPLAGLLARLADLDAAPAALPALSTVVNFTLAGGTADGASPAAGATVLGLQEALRARLPLLILCWAGGAGLLALRMLLGLAWVRRRSRPGAYRVDPSWQAALDRLAARMGLARRVVFGLVDDLTSPVTAGWWRPVVLVPASLATGMAPQLLEALLAHELAHVRRHDYLVNLLQSAIEILLFYHPAVWWLSHRIRVERELVADDLAASMLGEPRRLALALSELDLFQLSTPHLAHAAHGGNLMSRIKRLVRPQSEPINWKLALPVLGLALSAAVAAGAAQAERQAEPRVEPMQPARQVQPQVRQDAEAARADAEAMRADAEAARAASRAAAAQARTAARTAGSTRIHSDDNHGYALVSGSEQQLSISGDGTDWESLQQLRRNINGEFLWVRDGGKSWIIQDRDVLARAHAAYAPMERLGQQMNVYGKEMNQHGKAMDGLGKDMSRAAAGVQPDHARMGALQGEMSELGQQMGSLGRQMAQADEGERRRLDAEMKRLSAQMNKLGAQMSDASHPPGQLAAQQSMKEIGQRMDEAGKPMKALGQQMNVLGKQMEQEGKTADKTMRALIQEAMARGLAKPVPQG